MNPVPPPSIYIDDNFYEITISNSSLDSAGKVNDQTNFSFSYIFIKHN